MTPIARTLVLPLFILLGTTGCASLQKPSLEQQLDEAVASFEGRDGREGRVGIYLRRLSSGEEYRHRAEELFPTASMIKVPIMACLFARFERKELDYKQRLRWSRERIYPGTDLLAKVADGETLSFERLLVLMLAFSDNSASLWLQELAGGGLHINAWLASNGYAQTRMNSRTAGRKQDWEKYGWGQTTPHEMAELAVQIWTGRGFSRAAADAMHRHLTRSTLIHGALEELPPGIQVASKQGAVAASRSELFLVHAPSGPYVCCVITKQQTDRSWKRSNAGYALIRKVSRILWKQFEPASKWSKPPRSPAEKPGIGETCGSVCPVQTENVGKSVDLSRLSGCAGRVLMSRRSHAGFSAALLESPATSPNSSRGSPIHPESSAISTTCSILAMQCDAPSVARIDRQYPPNAA